MKIERVVCSDETHEVVLCKGTRPGETCCTPEGTLRWRWVEYGRGNTDDEQAAYLLRGGGFDFLCEGSVRFDQDAIVALRPKGALPRPESEAVAEPDPRDARIAELEAALAAEKARADRLDEALTIESVALAEQRHRHADDIVALNAAVAWKTSAQRIANCAVSVVEYLQSLEPVEVEDDYAHDAAMAGVELVLAALKEMQS